MNNECEKQEKSLRSLHSIAFSLVNRFEYVIFIRVCGRMDVDDKMGIHITCE